MGEVRPVPQPVRPLDDTWLKAAALGCLWASSEIVLGGFLHNLHVPLAGNLMAGVGIVLMVAVGHLWPVPGLCWRAGLICALMKALAPSAVIFGPMVAITCQACLMELAVCLFRRRGPGFLLGGMLAMSWNLVQIILNTLLSYGTRAVDLYLALVRWGQKSLGLPADRPWLPVLLVLTVQLVSGLLAALLGRIIGRRAAGEPPAMSGLTPAQVMEIRFGRPALPFPHSLGWLLADFALLVTALSLAGFAAWTLWLPVGLLAVGLWIRRYREAVNPLLRPRFWVWFVLLTGLSGALFSSLRQGWSGLWGGFAVGLAMNFRAAVLVVGFSALGAELRSPRIGRWLSRGRFRQLPAALEAAVETLPLVMANLPRFEELFFRPVAVFHRVVAQADFWLKRLTLKQVRRTGVLLLCGPVGEGKSKALQDLVAGLRADGCRVAGILSPSIYRNGLRAGHDLIDLASGRRTELSRLVGAAEPTGPLRVGNYSFRPDGIRAGQAALSPAATAEADLVMVDEVGPWELRDQGWAGWLYALTLQTHLPMIWVVRSDIVGQVREHWALQDPEIVDLSVLDPAELERRVRTWLAVQRGVTPGIPPSDAYCSSRR